MWTRRENWARLALTSSRMRKNPADADFVAGQSAAGIGASVTAARTSIVERSAWVDTPQDGAAKCAFVSARTAGVWLVVNPTTFIDDASVCRETRTVCSHTHTVQRKCSHRLTFIRNKAQKIKKRITIAVKHKLYPRYSIDIEFCGSLVVELSSCRDVDNSTTRFALLTNRRVVNYSTSRLYQRRVVPKFYAIALLRSAIAEKLRDDRLWT